VDSNDIRQPAYSVITITSIMAMVMNLIMILFIVVFLVPKINEVTFETAKYLEQSKGESKRYKENRKELDENRAALKRLTILLNEVEAAAIKRDKKKGNEEGGDK
jgi:large-conductance mechanosensitive channel